MDWNCIGKEKNIKKFMKIAAVCCAVLMLAGSSTQKAPEAAAHSEAKETKTESAGNAEVTQGEIEVTDICGREVTLPGPAKKGVLTFNFEEYFAVTGEEGVSKIAGWSRKYWEGRRQSSWDVFTEKFPELKEIPDVGYVPKNTFNVETVISLNPDLVIMAKNDYDSVQTDLERLDAAKIPVIFVDYHLQTMENHTNSTLLIGKVMGKEEQAQALVDFYKEQTGVVTKRIAEAGSTIIMISSELPEVLSMSNRVIVLYNGKVAGEFDPQVSSR